MEGIETGGDDRKNVKISPELFEQIEKRAVRPGHYQSVAEFVREAIRLRLDALQEKTAPKAAAVTA